MDHRGKIIRLPPNRVWRTYPGGRTLDLLAGVATPADSHFAEDWIGSVTRATNPGREHIAEGIAQVCVGADTTARDFAQLLASDPIYFLGADHVKKYGDAPRLLVKFLDSGTRLHFQVHPTRDFAQRFLGAASGKTEAYHVLATRDDVAEPFIYVGFQRPPTREALKRMILAQDIAGLEACFDRIPVRAGDTFIIPGGTPHALGAGIFMVEIQEPSDLVVRFEFERAGYVLPESARFMGRDLDFALRVFDLTPLTAEDIDRRVRCHPRKIREFCPGSWHDALIGPAQTDCFRVTKSYLSSPVVKDENSCSIVIVTKGCVTAAVGQERLHLRQYEKIFLPACLGPVHYTPEPHAEILECVPPSY
jgi:mannose-6-phosphate isomerase